MTGLGVVACDSEGKCIIKIQRRITGNLGPVNAEALAALLAVQIADRLGWWEVIFQGDCLNVIFDINNPFGVEGNHANIVKDITSLKDKHPLFLFHWISRDQNEEAHVLARGAISANEWRRTDEY